MATTDATPNPVKNQAFRFTFPIHKNDGTLITGATGLDSEVSKDAGTQADCTNEATEIATSTGVYYLDLTATEMNADTVAVTVKTTSTGAVIDTYVFYPWSTGKIKVQLEGITHTSAVIPTVTTTTTATTATNVTTVNGLAANVITAASINAAAFTAAKFATAAITTDAFTADAGLTNAGIQKLMDWNVANLVTPESIGAFWLTLSTLTTALVNAEVVDALNVDTYAEPSSVPAATASLVAKIGFLELLARNKRTQTATTQLIRNDGDSGTVATSTVSDDGTTLIVTKLT